MRWPDIMGELGYYERTRIFWEERHVDLTVLSI